MKVGLGVYTPRASIMDTAKLFKNGKSQAIRLPKEFRFRGTKVFIKKIGNAVVLIPEQDSWQSLIESMDLFSDDFMTEREQPNRANEP
jgi:antitoxin VapB